jgi:hypothetical protein
MFLNCGVDGWTGDDVHTAILLCVLQSVKLAVLHFAKSPHGLNNDAGAMRGQIEQEDSGKTEVPSWPLSHELPR